MHISKDELATKLMEQAATHIAAKEYELAINCYKHALFESPNNLKVLNVYVTFLFNLGKHRESLDALVLNMSQFGMTNEKQNLYKNVVNAVPAEVQQHLGLKTLTDDCELALYEMYDLEAYCLVNKIPVTQLTEGKPRLLSQTNDFPKLYEQKRFGLHKTPKIVFAVVQNLISNRNSFTSFTSHCAIREEFSDPALDDFKLPEIDSFLHYVPSINSLNTHLCGYKISNPQKILGKSINLLHFYDGNYYHWLIELLPNLSVCSKFAENIKVLVSTELPEQFYQALALVLPSNCEVVKIDLNTTIEQEEAILVQGMHYAPRKIHERSPHVVSDTYQAEFAVNWLRQSILNTSTQECKHKPESFIYLARKGNSGLRKNISEQDITLQMKLLGFDIIYTEDLSFIEQVRLFSNAKLIVGSAGSAYANLVFCSKECKVIMLTMGDGNDVSYHFFHKLANLVDVNLSYFSTQQTKGDNIANASRIFCTHAFDAKVLVDYLKNDVLPKVNNGNLVS